MNKPNPNDEIDPETGASIYGRAHMAWLLRISERQLDRLENAGIFTKRPDGKFHVVQTMDAFSAYQAAKASKPSPHDKVRLAQAELARRKLDREAEDLIAMQDAVETLDLVTGVFQQAVTVIENEVAADPDLEIEPDRLTLVISNTKASLAEKFSDLRASLVSGKRI